MAGVFPGNVKNVKLSSGRCDAALTNGTQTPSVFKMNGERYLTEAIKSSFANIIIGIDFVKVVTERRYILSVGFENPPCFFYFISLKFALSLEHSF